jgi:photosystem II stability/assembly factor-like uncharacterized protein
LASLVLASLVALSCANGPCARPETLQMIPNEQGSEALLLTNFGLLFPGATASGGGRKYELVCESYFGNKVPVRVARHPDGRVLTPGLDGVYASGTGCGFVAATGSVAGREVMDLALAPQDPARVWALTREPTALHLSSDGGVSFVQRPLPAGSEALRLSRIVAAPGPGADAARTLYLAGHAADVPLVVLASTDGGDSFTSHVIPAAVFARPATVTLLLGASPRAPGTLLLAAGSPAGADEIWRSSDGGASWTRVFTLAGTEVQAGFAWGEAGAAEDRVYLAGRELFERAGMPPARLYRSRDGGLTFPAADAVPSGERGPRYRCLEARGERLYACAGDEDAFLYGASQDQGASWSPLVHLGDITGSLPCAAGRCLTTAIWLCETYGVACDGLARPETPPPPADGGGTDLPAATCPDARDCGRGCACGLAAAADPNAGPAAVLVIALAAMLLRRRRSHLDRKGAG